MARSLSGSFRVTPVLGDGDLPEVGIVREFGHPGPHDASQVFPLLPDCEHGVEGGCQLDLLHSRFDVIICHQPSCVLAVLFVAGQRVGCMRRLAVGDGQGEVFVSGVFQDGQNAGWFGWMEG